MSLQSVILNDKIPFTLDVSTELENILYCNSINEHLFNVAIFNTKHKQLILEYNDEGNVRYAKIQVKIGKNLYKDSIFKVIITDDKTLESTFNPDFVKPVYVKEVPIKKVEPISEQVKIVEEELIPPVIEQKPKKIYEPLKVGGLYEVAVNTTVPMVLIESGEVENIFFCSSFLDQLFNVGILKTKDAELISEYVVESGEKYVFVDLLFENGDLYHKIKFKIVEVENQDVPISMFNLKTFNETTKSYVKFTGPEKQLVSETQELTIPEIIISEDIELVAQKKEYAQVIEKARNLEKALQAQNDLLVEKQEELQKKTAIVEAATDIEALIWENIQNKLETFKRDFSAEFKENSKKNLDEYVLDRLKQDLETTAEIDDKLKQLVEQAENTVKIKDGIKKYVDKAVEAALREAKKFAASVGGGGGSGSVAVQYANGGTMNGDLTINGGLQVNGSFKPPCGDLLPCETDTYSLGSSALRWKDLHVSGSTIYLGGVTLSAVNNTFVIPNDTLFVGNAVQEGDLNVTTSILSAGVDLLDIFGSSIYIQQLNWQPTVYELSITGGNTVSLSSIKTDYQAYSQYYAKTNFLSLTGGIIDGNLSVNDNLTVYGNLTALGNSYFVDTIFTTTSALSVINTGRGPALYVYQAPGPYPVASFVDGDGIEVLHVGNAQPGGLGRVGVNTNEPSTELTVNGAISSNGSISVVSMQAFNAVGVGIYPPGYFNLDVNGAAGNGTIGSSYGNLGLGSSGDISIYPNNNLLLGPVGNVGIGTTTPSVKLTVNGAISSNEIITANSGNSDDWSSVYTSSSQTSSKWDSVYSSWYTTSSLYVTTHYLSTNNVLLSAATVTNDINVGGTGYFNHIAAATKSFYIIHPDDPTKHLQYGSLESPYHGVRLTGKATIGKECRIELPSYIKSLVKLEGANVQLTNINNTQQIFVKNIDIDKNSIVIGRKYNFLNKNKLYDFFWSFTAIRRDIPDLKTEL